MKLSGGGRNGEEGQADEIMTVGWRYGACAWDTSHDLRNLLLMFNGQWVSYHKTYTKESTQDHKIPDYFSW